MNLASSLRPKNLSEFIGQSHLVGEGKIISRMIAGRQAFSMILWGPPGSGKTTLARIIANETHANFFELSGVTSGKEDLLAIVKKAEPGKTILFIDEIHRWNKAQQDVLLPHVESGLITLIGATTENPSFEIISPLLSRSRVFVLEGLSTDDLSKIIARGIKDLKKNITAQAKDLLIRLSGGDARIMLNALELSATTYNEKEITPIIVQEVFQTKSAGIYDKKADEHYNTISSYLKSMRASNVDASLYYLARMVESGEDAKFIARRMVVFASEDVGMAQPTALVVANEVFRACETIGYPECAINLAHGTVYLAKAKKDRRAYDAYFKAVEDVKRFPNEPIPLHLRNAPTKLMKELGYGKGYEMYPDKDKSLLPDKLKGKKYYEDS